MKIQIPELSVVVLIGASGSGKSTFARKHFRPTEVLSSDAMRGWVSDDDNDQGSTKDAFEVLHYVAGKRLANRRLVVVDATNVQPAARAPLVRLAREHHLQPVAIVLDLPEKICRERNADRPDRNFGSHVIRQHVQELRRSRKRLKREGFRHIFHLESAEAIEAVEIVRDRLWTDRRDEHGPFDIIGDLHGCFDEVLELLDRLGWSVNLEDGRYRAVHPAGRRIVFLGDLIDRGPKVAEALHLAMDLVEDGTALCVPGNHEVKLLKALRGKKVKIAHGLQETLDQLATRPPEFSERVASFIDSLISHFMLDEGKLVVAHGGMREEYQGRASGRVRAFALWGETTGEVDEFGLPVRYDWALEYRGDAAVVYGHTPVPEAEWLNNTVCIDTGCVFGGKLTALQWPERELVSVEAHEQWFEPIRPLELGARGRSAQAEHDDLLHLEDVQGKRIIHTRLRKVVTIREDKATPALEAMARFAVDPKWLVYLPPTMSPSETSEEEGYLEHPREALAYYQSADQRVICQAKHMGSRAVVVVCKDEDAARERFGTTDGRTGIVYTRTGRPMFRDPALEEELLARLRAACDASNFWEEHQTTWAVLDCELMPWSVKASSLIEEQYEPVGVAAVAALKRTVELLGAAADPELAERLRERLDTVSLYDQAWRPYCWEVDGLEGVTLAPFHLLATEGAVHVDKSHLWHLEHLGRLSKADGKLVVPTQQIQVDPSDTASVEAAIEWWTLLTGSGGEGMVVKPADFVAHGKRDLLQPAVKCRGREYLRIIYGPEYTLPEHLKRLRRRGLGRKRSLAMREFALGIEALERFVRREPLRRVHECVFGVLALECEPVDPRL